MIEESVLLDLHLIVQESVLLFLPFPGRDPVGEDGGGFRVVRICREHDRLDEMDEAVKKKDRSDRQRRIFCLFIIDLPLFEIIHEGVAIIIAFDIGSGHGTIASAQEFLCVGSRLEIVEEVPPVPDITQMYNPRLI